MASYEFPFNERIRTFLRLEDLFLKVQHHVQVGHQYNHHVAIMSMLQMLDVLDRADLKMELLQELERKRNYLLNLRDNPDIATQVLDETITKLDTNVTALKQDKLKFGQGLRDSEWLMSIKKREAKPGGLCEFDLPFFHHWLHQPIEQRQADFDRWLEKLMPMYEGIKIILDILRGSAPSAQYTAQNGSFQQSISSHRPAQLLIITLDDEACFPEVSANKYAMSIRFSKLDAAYHPVNCQKDIQFSMAICNL